MASLRAALQHGDGLLLGGGHAQPIEVQPCKHQ
jgi:hypothetical protein